MCAAYVDCQITLRLFVIDLIIFNLFLIRLLQVTGPIQVIPRTGKPNTRGTPCGDQGPSPREAVQLCGKNLFTCLHTLQFLNSLCQ